MVVKYRIGNQERARQVFNLKQLKGLRKACDEVDLIPKTFVYSSGTELRKRYNAQQCEYCGKQQGYFEVHHVKNWLFRTSILASPCAALRSIPRESY